MTRRRPGQIEWHDRQTICETEGPPGLASLQLAATSIFRRLFWSSNMLVVFGHGMLRFHGHLSLCILLFFTPSICNGAVLSGSFAAVLYVKWFPSGQGDDGDDDDTTIVQSGYHNNGNRYFHPSQSSTFQLVKLGNVNVTFLDHTNLLGYDGQDFAKVKIGFPQISTLAVAYGDITFYAAWKVQRGNQAWDDHFMQQCKFQRCRRNYRFFLSNLRGFRRNI